MTLASVNRQIRECAVCNKRGSLGPCSVHGPRRLVIIEAMPCGPVGGHSATIEGSPGAYGTNGKTFVLHKREVGS